MTTSRTVNEGDRGSLRLTTAQALVMFLGHQWSERDGERQRLIPAMFGIFGHGNVTGLGDALERASDLLPYMQARNEQSMVHAAIGYARSLNRRATLACTASIGPGSTNMVTGAATATVNRLPVLLLPADYYASRRQGNVLQQLEHSVSADVSVNDCLRPVSRFFDRILRPEQLLTALPQAMSVLTDPAGTGAVTIALPQDVQTEAFDYPATFFRERVWQINRQPPAVGRVVEAANLLATAQRPLIVAGGGVHYSEASAELRSFSEQFGIPVAETFAGKGSVNAPTALLLGGIGVEGTPAANVVASRADVVVCIGTRLSDFITGSRSIFQHRDVRFISINVSPGDASKMSSLPMVGDARESLRSLAAALDACGYRSSSGYRDEVKSALAHWQGQLVNEVFIDRPSERLSQGRLIELINEAGRPGDIVIGAAGSPPGDLLKVFDCTGGVKCQIEFGYSCMGHEIPAALGAKLASGPTIEVSALIGDGTYLMNPTEILTAVQAGLKITIVISENHGFQVIKRLQLWRVGRPFGNEFRAVDAESARPDGPFIEVDLPANAASMGARTWYATTAAEVAEALRIARDEPFRPCVIVVATEPERFLPSSQAFWDVPPPEVSDAPETTMRRREYELERQAQRYLD